MTREGRIEKLKKLIEDNPDDSFTLFALAMEFIGARDDQSALKHLDQLLKTDPDYVPAYYQKAQIHVRLSQKPQARQTIEAGIPKSVDAGQLHARDKLQELLKTIESV